MSAIIKLARSFAPDYLPAPAPTAAEIGTLRLRSNTTLTGPRLYVGVADDAAAAGAAWMELGAPGGAGDIISNPALNIDNNITPIANVTALNITPFGGQTANLMEVGTGATGTNFGPSGHLRTTQAGGAGPAAIQTMIDGVIGSQFQNVAATASIQIQADADPLGDAVARITLRGTGVGNEMLIENAILDGGLLP